MVTACSCIKACARQRRHPNDTGMRLQLFVGNALNSEGVAPRRAALMDTK
jgi:hypothetical protein